VNSLAEARQIIGRGEIDFRKTAIVDRPFALDAAAGSAESDSVRLVNYQPDSLSLAVQSKGASLLILSESYYPGWKAWVDAAPASVQRVNIALRGVWVNDGSHVVRMQFSPWILPASLAVTIVTLAGLAMMAFSGRRNSHKRVQIAQGLSFSARLK
jgi:hypothetical protein